MTTVQISRQGNRLALTARGHAAGSAVVCGIISALVQGLATALRNGPALGMEVRDLRVSLRPGWAEITCRGGDAVWQLFALCRITLMQVAMAQPEAIRVE